MWEFQKKKIRIVKILILNYFSMFMKLLFKCLWCLLFKYYSWTLELNIIKQKVSCINLVMKVEKKNRKVKTQI